MCEAESRKVLVVLFSTESHCSFLAPAPAQVTPIAAAQPAHPWGASSHSLLTPLNKTALQSLLPASPGRNLQGFLGLHLHHLPMDRKILVSGQLVLNPVLEKMQPKRMQNQIARVLPLSPAQGMFPHPLTWPRKGPMGCQDWKEPQLPFSEPSLQPKVSQSGAFCKMSLSPCHLPDYLAWLSRGKVNGKGTNNAYLLCSWARIFQTLGYCDIFSVSLHLCEMMCL